MISRPNNNKHRKRLFKKYKNRCAIENCLFNEVLEIHHLKPRRLGGEDGMENLILLCPNHHALADRGKLW